MDIIRAIAADPEQGVLMPGTGGARKLRFAGRSKGKSGGYRTVHYFGGDDIPVFLLVMLSKGERANLSKAEQNALHQELAALADDYRDSVRQRAKRPRSR